MEWTIPALTFPAKAGNNLPTLKGWKAELALAYYYYYLKYLGQW